MYNLKEVITMQSLEDLFYTVSAEKKNQMKRWESP